MGMDVPLMLVGNVDKRTSTAAGRDCEVSSK
jgi:hypothetical protein